MFPAVFWSDSRHWLSMAAIAKALPVGRRFSMEIFSVLQAMRGMGIVQTSLKVVFLFICCVYFYVCEDLLPAFRSFGMPSARSSAERFWCLRSMPLPLPQPPMHSLWSWGWVTPGVHFLLEKRTAGDLTWFCGGSDYLCMLLCK